MPSVICATLNPQLQIGWKQVADGALGARNDEKTQQQMSILADYV